MPTSRAITQFAIEMIAIGTKKSSEELVISSIRDIRFSGFILILSRRSHYIHINLNPHHLHNLEGFAGNTSADSIVSINFMISCFNSLSSSSVLNILISLSNFRKCHINRTSLTCRYFCFTPIE